MILSDSGFVLNDLENCEAKDKILKKIQQLFGLKIAKNELQIQANQENFGGRLNKFIQAILYAENACQN